jgi:hypothetical protein
MSDERMNLSDLAAEADRANDPREQWEIDADDPTD